MSKYDIFIWLTTASDLAIFLAYASFFLLMISLLQRFHVLSLGWTGRSILLLLISLGLLHIILEAIPHGWPEAALKLCANLIIMIITGFVWPFLRQIRAQLSDRTSLLVKNRADLTDAAMSETRYWLQQAEKIAHVGHWRYFVAEGHLIWSDEIYQILGLHKNDAAPDLASMIAAYHPEDQEAVVQSFQDALAAQKNFEIPVRLIRSDGTTRYVMSRGGVQTDGNGKTVSVFGVFQDITEQKETEQELKAVNLASEIANQSLRTMAMQDSLTGLPNRRQFDLTLATEFKRAAREKTVLGLIMIDLDQFKAYNDHHGHPAGDDCLRMVAEAIAGVLQRPADMAARYGGEEMAVSLPNTNLAGAEIVANYILKAVRDLCIPHEANPGKIVTISCGAATFCPRTDPHVPAMLIQRADEALYGAKRAGRDRVKCSHAQTGSLQIK